MTIGQPLKFTEVRFRRALIGPAIILRVVDRATGQSCDAQQEDMPDVMALFQAVGGEISSEGSLI